MSPSPKKAVPFNFINSYFSISLLYYSPHIPSHSLMILFSQLFPTFHIRQIALIRISRPFRSVLFVCDCNPHSPGGCQIFLYIFIHFSPVNSFTVMAPIATLQFWQDKVRNSSDLICSKVSFDLGTVCARLNFSSTFISFPHQVQGATKGVLSLKPPA